MWLESTFHQYYEIILVDQRGTGLWHPSLDCPEYSDDEYENWIRACRTRLIKQGIDLTQYHSMSVVWDVHDLLVALELEQVNLYGNSYGSRLAQLLSRIAPGRIRSMVLDGVYPPPRYDIEELAYNAERSLERLFADCEANAACRRLYPDLREMFYRVVTEMNASSPELNNMGESTGVTMNGDEFLAWTIGMLRYEAALPVIPSLIALFDAGFYDLLLLLDAFVKAPNWNDNDSYSEGANFSIRCSEGLTLADSERTKANDMGVAEEITKVLNPVAQHHLDQCEIREARSAPGLITQVVASDVPTLLLSGAL